MATMTQLMVTLIRILTPDCVDHPTTMLVMKLVSLVVSRTKFALVKFITKVRNM